jgi:hypothetical protein
MQANSDSFFEFVTEGFFDLFAKNIGKWTFFA